ncbi:anthranilate synthase, amidotransferase component [hydrocarbon metagenome]|uniref:Anthranilate synthase, amidotransferase component n=1 Tax=hydrocarbon metagenome TaxID=938273 RepID=A0A0W8E2X9_9ZZZZ
MILMIDNYDSFTYNLVQYLEEFGEEVQVYKNDAITTREIIQLKPEAIMISPGPCSPREAGISVDTIRDCYDKIPILGICLGHQSIGYAFGARIEINYRLMHGKVSKIYHDQQTIYQGLSEPFYATRYHSLVVARNSLPNCLEIASCSEEGEIMGIRHKYFPVEGVQFHPESIMTPEGKKLLGNFLAWIREAPSVQLLQVVENGLSM